TKLNIDFLKISRPIMIFSFNFVIASVVLLFTKGLNYGIDFTGGAEVQVQVPDDWDTARLRETLASGGLTEASVIRIEDATQREFMIKIQVEPEQIVAVGERVTQILSAALPQDQFQTLKVDVVGPQAGEELWYS